MSKVSDRQVSILGVDGHPMKRSRTSMLTGGEGRFSGPAYDAADIYGQHMAAWTPFLWSPDAELNPYRDRIVARTRDLARNDGWASGAVTRMIDNVVGHNFRPISHPDHHFLARLTGNPKFDHVWAKEFGRAVNANWRHWADEDVGKYCDAARKMTFGQMMRVAFRHYIVDGDALATLPWLPERVGYGRARYCTTVQMIDPDRLSNPQMRFDQQTMRGGVEVDEWGAAVAYYIRKAHAGDWFSAVESLTWEKIPRETSWGRPIVVHHFDTDRAGQHRGGAGMFAPVVQRLKMLAKYDGVELDAAIINAIFAAYVESPFDRELVGEALDDGEKLGAYQGQRREFHDDNKLMLGNARIPILFPGEKINPVTATRPTSNYVPFQSSILRNLSAATGLSAQQISNDWSDVNYSSGRNAMIEALKSFTRRRGDFACGFAGIVRAAWLEEAMEVDDLPMPQGQAADFAECRGAFARAKWLGPGIGWVNPVDEPTGALLRLDGGLTTLEDLCAEQGLDYEEVLEQRRYEINLFKELDINIPEWAGQVAAERIKQRPAAE